jgi:hypothetical protein
MNFLNWYFTSAPQKSFADAATGVKPFAGGSPFEIAMNEMFAEMENRFHQILANTFRGDTLCCMAKKRNVNK